MRQLSIALVTAVLLAGCGGEATPAAESPAPTPATSQSPTPSPTPSPSPAASTADVDWRKDIPAGLPLASGYPDEEGLTGPRADIVAFEGRVCSKRLRPDTDSIDRLAVRFEQPEDSRTRKLMIFPDDITATAALDRFVAAYRNCPEDGEARISVDGNLILTTYVSDGKPSLGQESIHVYQVGNAVLLTSVYGEAAGATDLDAAAKAAARAATTDEPVVASLCVFAAEPCPDPAPPTEASDIVLGPDGYGALRFGMSMAEAKATGQLAKFGSSACITPDRGLEALFAQEGMTTPEGIGLGSTRAQVRAAYGDLITKDLTHGYWRAPAASGLRYEFGFNQHNRVTELDLARVDQHCFG